MKTYKIQDREAGNVIESGLTKEEAEKKLAEFEENDKKDGTYTPDFYEIVEEFKPSKEVIRYEVRAYAAYHHYYFNKETHEFDGEECVFENSKYSWESQEEMLDEFFKNFKPSEFKNSLDAEIKLCKVKELWTREDIEDDWDFETEESQVIISFGIYDWMKNNRMI